MRFVMPVVVVLSLAGIGDPVGSTIHVPSGGDLQAALNNARPGDTILLARDASYVGNFLLPARRGDDDRVIIPRRAPAPR